MFYSVKVIMNLDCLMFSWLGSVSKYFEYRNVVNIKHKIWLLCSSNLETPFQSAKCRVLKYLKIPGFYDDTS